MQPSSFQTLRLDDATTQTAAVAVFVVGLMLALAVFVVLFG